MKIFLEGLNFDDKHQCRTEWRILWRRVAGGLKAGQQLELYEQLSPSLPIDESKRKKKKYHKTVKGKIFSHEGPEIWMALASLERLPVDNKEMLGNQLLERFSDGALNPKELWALSDLVRVSLFMVRLTRLFPCERCLYGSTSSCHIIMMQPMPWPMLGATGQKHR